ncbi:MAG TPA: ABC transporter permease [Candidatus Polarisedimenticolaceae bacterium]|nr:ABC transporter permease [Candidatus Polarisedimenticolaceae bacterium]
MAFWLQLRQLLRDLRSQKMRTFMTTFGIVWGTAAVSMLLAFGQGLHKQMYKASAGLGENICIAWPSRTSLTFEGLGKGRQIQLDEDDMELIRLKADNLDALSSEYESSFKLIYEKKAMAVDVHGVTPVFASMRTIVPKDGGRWINRPDWDGRRRVAFLGNDLAETVFGPTDPVGKTIRLNGSPFLVIGVMVKKPQDSSYSGRDKDNVFIPGTTMRALTGAKYVDEFLFKAKKANQTEALKAQVLEIAAGKHRFDPKDKEAIGIWDTTDNFKFLDTFGIAFSSFLGIVGSLTLVVGGIGVSNIMNVVVEERTREIGIKMALGARPGSILLQFLLETLLITGIGGAIGLGITFGICAAFPALGFTDYVGDPVVSPFIAAITAGLLGTIGLLAGYFPARDAARLDPVVAMKL